MTSTKLVTYTMNIIYQDPVCFLTHENNATFSTIMLILRPLYRHCHLLPRSLQQPYDSGVKDRTVPTISCRRHENIGTTTAEKREPQRRQRGKTSGKDDGFAADIDRRATQPLEVGIEAFNLPVWGVCKRRLLYT